MCRSARFILYNHPFFYPFSSICPKLRAAGVPARCSIRVFACVYRPIPDATVANRPHVRLGTRCRPPHSTWPAPIFSAHSRLFTACSQTHCKKRAAQGICACARPPLYTINIASPKLKNRYSICTAVRYASRMRSREQNALTSISNVDSGR